MRKIFDQLIEELYKQINPTINYGAFKTSISDYLRNRHEELSSAKTMYFTWATPQFANWVTANNHTVEDIMADVAKYVASTIIVLRLNPKINTALTKAHVWLLSDLKDYVKNPQNLATATGLGLDLVQELLATYSQHLLTNK